MNVWLKIILKLVLVVSVCLAAGISSRFRPIKAEGHGLVQRDGAVVYSQNCARCHGLDGRARTAKGRAVGATNLTSNDWLPDTARDTRLVNRGKEEMPSFKGKLKPAEIEAVVSYIRRFKR